MDESYAPCEKCSDYYEAKLKELEEWKQKLQQLCRHSDSIGEGEGKFKCKLCGVLWDDPFFNNPGRS